MRNFQTCSDHTMEKTQILPIVPSDALLDCVIPQPNADCSRITGILPRTLLYPTSSHLSLYLFAAHFASHALLYLLYTGWTSLISTFSYYPVTYGACNISTTYGGFDHPRLPYMSRHATACH